ncbi:MAG: ATP-binding protein [Thermodesulfovibrionales bacterium]
MNSLILLRIAETPRIEYKAELNMCRDAEKRELCKDVSAMANSQGGYLFFGITATNGTPTSIPGIDFDEKAKERLYQILLSGVSPRIQSIQDCPVHLRNGKVVLILKTDPDGYLHQVKYDDERYYKRAGTITVSMQSADVETFVRSQSPSNRQEQVQEIIKRYYGELKSRRYFKGVSGKGILALSIIPEIASYKLDLGSLPGQFTLLFQPLYCSGWDSEITGRSRFTFGQVREERVPFAVTEVTELGEVKAFNSFMLENKFGERYIREGCTGYIPSVAYEREFIIAIHRYLNSLKQIGVSPPFFIHIALFLIHGYILAVDPIQSLHFGQSRIYQGEDLTPDLVHVTSEEEFADLQAVARTLRPMFNYIWREFGFERSYNYDINTGAWNPQ